MDFSRLRLLLRKVGRGDAAKHNNYASIIRAIHSVEIPNQFGELRTLFPLGKCRCILLLPYLGTFA